MKKKKVVKKKKAVTYGKARKKPTSGHTKVQKHKPDSKKKKVCKKERKKNKPVKRCKYKSTGKKTGRPTEYNNRFAKIAADVFELGGTNRQVCDLLKISEACFYKWMKDHADFKKAVTDARDVVNLDQVKKSNLKRCLGYKYTEVTREPGFDKIMKAIGKKKGVTTAKVKEILKELCCDADGMIITKKVTKHMPGDGALIKNYLFNKSGGEFQQRQAVELEAGKSLVDVMAKLMME